MKKLLLLFLLFPTLLFAESYLCIAEAAGGLVYNESTDKFNGTSFSTDSKYIVKKENNSWVINYFGTDVDLTSGKGCNYSKFNLLKDTDGLRLSCNITFGEMRVDTKNLRYIKTHVMGYQGRVLKEKGLLIDTPSIEVGNCSKV
jgi:hypothetical protein